MTTLRLALGLGLTFSAAITATSATADAHAGLASLAELSVEALRDRSYGSEPVLAAEYACPGYAEGATGEILAYESDGLNVYARLQRPEGPAPEGGYPVVLFLHGWVGADNAPAYEFSCNDGGYYAPFINAHAANGHVVLMPGFRGHGTVDGMAAEGIEFLHSWDNGSYLSPVFYAIDTLNLLAGLPALDGAALAGDPLPLDLDRIHVVGHSQGGDAAAMVLAAVGEGAGNGLSVATGSLWAATYVDRFTQLLTYRAMERATEAFLAGDGTWNGTAVGRDGTVNPNFVFGYPPNWIGTLDQSEWTWQADFWTDASVQAAVETKLEEMYGAINANVADMGDLAWSVAPDNAGSFSVTHDERLVTAMQAIGAYDAAEYVTEPVALHFSDRDFYSIPEWNIAFCARVDAAGGSCRAYEYPGTSHTLGVADQGWFSPEGTQDGFGVMLERDAALIASGAH